METVMPYEHDPLKRRPLRKTPDGTEARLSAELAYLMRDPRYRDGDPDYQAYIQGQFRRVYDDPTGRPQPLRLGRPKAFVDALEPFDPARERRLRLGTGEEAASGAEAADLNDPRRARISGLGVANRRSGEAATRAVRRVSSSGIQSSDTVDKDSLQPTPSPSAPHRQSVESGMRHAIEQRSSDHRAAKLPDDPELRERLQRTSDSARTMSEYWKGGGLDLSSDYLNRYLDGGGGTTELPWSMLEEYSYVPNAVETIRNYYDEWLGDERDDDKVGSPFLSMADGEILQLGEPGYQSPVQWENEWYLNHWTLALTGSRELFQDPHDVDFLVAFGSAEVKGYGDFTFVRRGDLVHVVGHVDMRFDEIFNFEEDGVAYLASSITPNAPSIRDSDLRELAQYGLAKPFRTVSNQLWLVSGYIVLDDGGPDVSRTGLRWRLIDPNAPVPLDPSERLR
jgi:hypothetical protein